MEYLQDCKKFMKFYPVLSFYPGGPIFRGVSEFHSTPPRTSMSSASVPTENASVRGMCPGSPAQNLGLSVYAPMSPFGGSSVGNSNMYHTNATQLA